MTRSTTRPPLLCRLSRRGVRIGYEFPWRCLDDQIALFIQPKNSHTRPRASPIASLTSPFRILRRDLEAELVQSLSICVISSRWVSSHPSPTRPHPTTHSMAQRTDLSTPEQRRRQAGHHLHPKSRKMDRWSSSIDIPTLYAVSCTGPLAHANDFSIS
jgi:hypothetical protein